jgi:hypothetical protein
MDLHPSLHTLLTVTILKLSINSISGLKMKISHDSSTVRIGSAPRLTINIICTLITKTMVTPLRLNFLNRGRRSGTSNYPHHSMIVKGNLKIMHSVRWESSMRR